MTEPEPDPRLMAEAIAGRSRRRPCPSPDEVERSRRVAREHQPSVIGSSVLAQGHCPVCDEPWPCREYHDSIRTQTAAYRGIEFGADRHRAATRSI